MWPAFAQHPQEEIMVNLYSGVQVNKENKPKKQGKFKFGGETGYKTLSQILRNKRLYNKLRCVSPRYKWVEKDFGKKLFKYRGGFEVHVWFL